MKRKGEESHKSSSVIRFSMPSWELIMGGQRFLKTHSIFRNFPCELLYCWKRSMEQNLNHCDKLLKKKIDERKPLNWNSNFFLWQFHLAYSHRGCWTLLSLGWQRRSISIVFHDYRLCFPPLQKPPVLIKTFRLLENLSSCCMESET